MTTGKIIALTESESEVTQSCPTLCDPMDCSLPDSFAPGISQARVLQWVAISFSRGSSWPRDWTQVFCLAGRHFTVWATREILGAACGNGDLLDVLTAWCGSCALRAIGPRPWVPGKNQAGLASLQGAGGTHVCSQPGGDRHLWGLGCISADLSAASGTFPGFGSGLLLSLSYVWLFETHGLWHARLPCPSPSPRVCSNSCLLSRWCHTTLSSPVIPFSSCLQSFPASGSFSMSWLFTLGGQGIY